jgi:hypothetical protein
MMSALSIVTEDVGKYVHWGVVQISVTNLVIIAAMVVLFVLALFVPFGSDHGSQADRERQK